MPVPSCQQLGAEYLSEYFLWAFTYIVPVLWYHLGMGTTLHSLGISLPLAPASANLHADNRDALYTALNCGWIAVKYRKANGTPVTRFATRNPAIVGAYGTDGDKEAIRLSDNYVSSILYYDYTAGSLRSFRVDSIIDAWIPSHCPEINH